MSPAGTALSTKYRFPEKVLVASTSNLSGVELLGAARWKAAAVAPVKVSPMKYTAPPGELWVLVSTAYGAPAASKYEFTNSRGWGATVGVRARSLRATPLP